MSMINQIRSKSLALSLRDLGSRGYDSIEVLSESDLLALVKAGSAGGGAEESQRLQRENIDLRREVHELREELESAGELIQRLQELAEG